MSLIPRFPDGFLWGAATSAYQIEGSPLADGAGPSIWDRFVRTPGNVHDGDTGDVACDHYRRWQDDVGLMAELGLASYRFSLSWSRIIPEGTGRVNQAGLDFYDRLVDALLERGITPNVTLHHWDLPAALDNRGGWLNPDVATWFGAYARSVFEALDDRIPMWITINEPWVVMDGGYATGALAPGHRSFHEIPIVAHNLLRAHAEALAVYREVGQHRIGLGVNLEPKTPASDEDRDAARLSDAYMNRYFLDPVFRGTYPPELPSLFGDAWVDPDPADLDAIHQPLDFLGVNYYKTAVVARDPDGYPVPCVEVAQPRRTYTILDWPVHPAGLTRTLTWVRDTYGDLPLYVTENGSAFYDPPVVDGEVRDPHREAYLSSHVRAVHDALADGVDVRGYYAWSLMDNFEWSHGYRPRFGLVHVDFETQARTVKQSGHFYARVCQSNGAAVFGE